MAGRWLGTLLSASAAMVVVGGTATLVGATQSTPPAAVSVSYEVPRPASAAPRAAASEALTQTIRLEIRGGDLTIDPGSLVVDLTPHGDVLRGTLPRITIVDARGTLRGWTARVRVANVVAVDADGSLRRVPPGRAVLTPSAPSLVAGSLEGIEAGRSVRGRGLGTLLRADKRSGGGTYVGGGTIEIARPDRWVAATARIELAVS